MKFSLFSPAKINLFLRVLGRRQDGYHELATLIQTIDLADTLTFTLAKEDRLTSTDPTLPTDSSNLIIKALQLFRKQTGLNIPVDIHLEKKIPIQAGLGGGSSNAATTLKALNTLFHTQISNEELQSWAAELGSDVPFFFSTGTAYCTGRGEIVQNVRHIPLPPFELRKPQEGLSTSEIYKALDLSECASHDPKQLLNDFLSGKLEFINDLEKPAFRLLPSLATFKQKLTEGGFTSSFMTGSGSAWVCLYSVSL